MTANKFFPEIHGILGFGCMRLPMKGAQVDHDEFSRMTDAFLDAGFNYFDTAHGYLDGQSETAIRDCVAARYDRSRFILTNKLSTNHFTSQEQIRPLFREQLAACGVDYFDFYLMHAQDKTIYEKYQRCRAYETASELKKEGLIRHLGISFHDKAAVLERILTDHPEIEVVQIQFNYLDYEDASVESRKVYEVCERFGKPVLVMEPVKGGSLAALPAEAQAIFDALRGGSHASYAVRFAAGFPNICAVLSGMSDMEQMRDNIASLRDFQPLSDRERAAVDTVCGIFRGLEVIRCTACRYCTAGCPMDILIPDLFACLNKKRIFQSWNQDFYYNSVLTVGHGKASDCVRCGQCEDICPQHLPIRELLEQVASEFE